MFIRSTLFSKGHPCSAEPRLADVLEGHKRKVIAQIKAVMSLKEMTDAFLAGLVKDSLVEPLVINFDKATREFRNEDVETRRGTYSANVARLSIPFTGDPLLLAYSPKSCGLTFPQGEVYGNKIQFDVIMSGDHDAERVKEDVRKNREMIQTATASINEQVREFNQSLPEAVKTAFTAKFEDLKKQHAIFDDLGIKEDEELVDPPVFRSSTPSQPKKKVTRQTYIIQYIEKQYVEQLTQTNNNIGDVNNMVQSG